MMLMSFKGTRSLEHLNDVFRIQELSPGGAKWHGGRSKYVVVSGRVGSGMLF